MKLHCSLALLQSAVLADGARVSRRAPAPEVTHELGGQFVQMIPLNRALLCVNCELITETRRDCPQCGSKQLMKVTQLAGGSIYHGAAGARNDGRPDELPAREREKRGLLR